MDSRENELAQKEIKEQIRAGRLLSIHEVTETLFRVIEQRNDHPFKNRGCDTGKSPRQVYNEETLKHPVTTLSTDVLDYIFLPVERGKVKRSQVKVKHPWLKTLTYYHPDLSSCGGDEVEVRFDPFDQGRVWVFDHETHERHEKRKAGKLICVAEEWGMINPKVSDQVAAKIHAQRALEKQVRDLYREFAPPGADGRSKIRKLHPDERVARGVAETRLRQTATPRQAGLRVVRTPFDDVDPETGEVLEKAAVGMRMPSFGKRAGGGVDLRVGIDMNRAVED